MARRRQEITWGKRIARWVEAPFRPVAFGLRRWLRGLSSAPAQWLAQRCTPRGLQNMLAGICLLVLCLVVFFQAVPMLERAAPVSYPEETPELVNTVTFSEETTMESLEVQWLRGPVTVRPYNGTCITVNEYAAEGLKTEEKGRIYLASKNLTVEWQDSLLPIVDTGVGGGLYKSLEILIPREQAAALEYIRILSGESDITVTGLTNSISARVENTVGEINLDGLSAPVTVLKSESGNIICNKLKTADLQLNIDSGTVTLDKCDVVEADMRSVNGPIAVQGKLLAGTVLTYSAPMDLQLSSIPRSLELISTNGNIVVEVPKNTPENRLSAASEYGSVTVNKK